MLSVPRRTSSKWRLPSDSMYLFPEPCSPQMQASCRNGLQMLHTCFAPATVSLIPAFFGPSSLVSSGGPLKKDKVRRNTRLQSFHSSPMDPHIPSRLQECPITLRMVCGSIREGYSVIRCAQDISSPPWGPREPTMARDCHGHLGC